MRKVSNYRDSAAHKHCAQNNVTCARSNTTIRIHLVLRFCIVSWSNFDEF